MGDAESIRNLFEQVGRGGIDSLTIDDLCLSVIVPPLMEKIRDGKDPRSSIKSILCISAQRPSDPPHPFQNGL